MYLMSFQRTARETSWAHEQSSHPWLRITQNLVYSLKATMKVVVIKQTRQVAATTLGEGYGCWKFGIMPGGGTKAPTFGLICGLAFSFIIVPLI